MPSCSWRREILACRPARARPLCCLRGRWRRRRRGRRAVHGDSRRRLLLCGRCAAHLAFFTPAFDHSGSEYGIGSHGLLRQRSTAHGDPRVCRMRLERMPLPPSLASLPPRASCAPTLPRDVHPLATTGPPPPYENRPNMEKPSSVDFDRFVGVRGAVAHVAVSRVWGVGSRVSGLRFSGLAFSGLGSRV